MFRRFAPGDWVAFKKTPQKACGCVLHSEGSNILVLKMNGFTATWHEVVLTKLSPRNAPKYTQADVRALIDVALDVKDRRWFEELTSELKRIQEVEG